MALAASATQHPHAPNLTRHIHTPVFSACDRWGFLVELPGAGPVWFYLDEALDQLDKDSAGRPSAAQAVCCFANIKMIAARSVGSIAQHPGSYILSARKLAERGCSVPAHAVQKGPRFPPLARAQAWREPPPSFPRETTQSAKPHGYHTRNRYD